MSTLQPMELRPLRLLVVDDHPAVRAGLSLLVASENVLIWAEAACRDDALRQLNAERPDLALVDLSLDGEDGLGLVGDLRRLEVPVLVYSMHSDADHIGEALTAGALGYVTKTEIRDVLLEGIRAVAAGRRFISPKAALVLADRFSELPADDPVASLSHKEQEVFRLIGEGEGTAEIAATLGISTHTVESYYIRIQLKLEVQGMYELRHRAIQHLRGPR